MVYDAFKNLACAYFHILLLLKWYHREDLLIFILPRSAVGFDNAVLHCLSLRRILINQNLPVPGTGAQQAYYSSTFK